MPRQNETSLDAQLKKYAPDTHHIRLKAAPAMFHHLCGKMPESEARLLTCALLAITPLGLSYALERDRNNPDKKIIRNHQIVTMRASGASYDRIQARFGLSRVQVYRIIKQQQDMAFNTLKPAENSHYKLENKEAIKIQKNSYSNSICYKDEILAEDLDRDERMAVFCGYQNYTEKKIRKTSLPDQVPPSPSPNYFDPCSFKKMAKRPERTRTPPVVTSPAAKAAPDFATRLDTSLA